MGKRRWTSTAVVIVLASGLVPSSRARGSVQADSYTATPVRSPRRFADIAGARWPAGGGNREKPRTGTAPRRKPTATERKDPLARAPTGRAVAQAFSVLGLPFSASFPPDVAGEAGTTQYVQMVNALSFGGSGVGVFSKTDGTRMMIGILSDLAPSTGPGSDCRFGLGDPVPIFDQLAGRWVLTEMIAGPVTGFCAYVFDGADVINDGVTIFEFPTAVLPDYMKWGVMPNAYFIGANDPEVPVSDLFALDRTAILAGLPTVMVHETVPALPAFAFHPIAPVDLDGSTPPPAGAVGTFVQSVDDEVNGTPNAASDSIRLFELAPNFTTPASSVLTGPVDVAVAEFSSDLCGLVGLTCIRQPRTKIRLDPLREPVMQRPLLRVFGDHQSLVGCFVTDVTGTDIAGVRWFELRRAATATNGGWSLFQEGTVGTSEVSRWVPSIAMNGSGDIALGYSASGRSLFPSIFATGRHSGDDPGTMTQGEAVIVAGRQSQVRPRSNANRWGDYTEMSVDPSDDTTFFYTNEFIGGRSHWRTAIAKFTLN